MEYVLIIILQAIGISLNVLQKVMELDKNYPDDSLSDVFETFWKKDRVTVFISLVVVVLNVVGHYIAENYTKAHESIEYYDLYTFGIALVLGYAGQWLIYKWLGKAAEALDKKVESKLQ